MQQYRPVSDKELAQGNSSSYLSDDTIAAVSTALGGAVAMVRVSGKSSFAALERLTGKAHSEYEPRKASLARIHSSSGAALDEALILKFVNPDSFTGEDVVELHLHGGSYLATRVMEEVAAF